MISRNFRLSRLIAFFSIFIIVLQGCKKETNVGSSLIPDEDILNAIKVDTFTVEAYTEQTDSIYTENISRIALGEFNDPDFGITHAQFFTQFLLSKVPSFGTNPLIDSIVLSFQVDTIYKPLAQQSTTFKAYTLDEAFSSSVPAYFSTDALAYSTEIGSTLFLADTGIVRIKLQDAVGQNILSALSTDLDSNVHFVKFFKGITIKAQQVSLNADEGALYMINPSHSNTKITLYYHNDGNSGLTFNLTIPAAARYFGKYSHDYSGTTDLKAQLNDHTLGKSQLFLQSLGGTRVIIKFPHIAEWAKDKQFLIHRAELILPRKTGSDNVYSLPQGTILFKDSLGYSSPTIGNDGTINSKGFPDFNDPNYSGMSNPGIGTYGGGFETSKGQYRFVITNYIYKKILAQENTTKLILYSTANGVSPKRVILDGTDQNNVSRTKLLLYYSTKK